MYKYTVVIADDEMIARRYVQMQFEKRYPNVQIVGVYSDGQGVINHLTGMPADIVISDIRMPNKTGIDVARYIRENNLDTDIILMSGYKDFEYVRQAINLDVNYFITKPVKFSEMDDYIQRICDKREEKAVQTIQNATEQLRHWENERQKLRLLLLSGISIEELHLREPYSEFVQNPCAAICLDLAKHAAQAGQQPLFWKDSCEDDNDKLSAFCLEENDRSAIILVLSKNKDSKEFSEVTQKFTESVKRLLSWDNKILKIRQSITYFNSLHEFHEKRSSFRQYDMSSSITERVQWYVLTHLDERLSLRDISKKFNANYSYLSRLFKKETDMNFLDYVVLKKIEEAKALLKTGQYTVAEVTHMVGYTDLKHFRQLFSKAVGISPKKYFEHTTTFNSEENSNE